MLSREDLVQERAYPVGLDGCPGLQVDHIAVQSEGIRLEMETLRAEEAHEGLHEFEHDLIDIKHEQRAVVPCEFRDLPNRFRIIAHVDRSCRSSPSGKARSAS